MKQQQQQRQTDRLCRTCITRLLADSHTPHLLTCITLFKHAPTAGLKHADAAGGLHLGVRGRLDAAFRALADLLQSSSINNTNTYTSAASVNGHTNSSSSSSSTDGQGSGGGSSNSVSGFGRALSEGLRQLLTRGQSGRCANSCSSLAHAAADGAGVVDVRDVPALLSVLLPGLAHKEAAELAAWLRAGGGQSSSGQQQQQQGHVMGCYGASQAAAAAHVTLRELEGAVKSLVEARELDCFAV